MSSHRELREALGAYVLGRLEPAVRHEVDDHLQECQDCRDVLAALSGLPPLLGRLDADEARGGMLAPSPDLVRNLTRRLGEARRRERRQLRTWRGVAAAALVAAALIAYAPWDSGPDVRTAPVQAVATEASQVAGQAGAIAWEWGTTVQLDVEGLPAREGYRLWAVAQDGRREQAGAWGPTTSRQARVRGACSIHREDLARVEVTDDAGELLFSFEF